MKNSCELNKPPTRLSYCSSVDRTFTYLYSPGGRLFEPRQGILILHTIIFVYSEAKDEDLGSLH